MNQTARKKNANPQEIANNLNQDPKRIHVDSVTEELILYSLAPNSFLEKKAPRNLQSIH
jgi:hypothetical protein